MEIKFWQPMRLPTVTHNALRIYRKKRGKKYVPYIGKSNELLDAEEKWRAYFAGHSPARPLDGPLFLDVMLVFFREGVAHGELAPMDGKPDWDNMLKTIQDVMASLGWFSQGDQQVFDAHVSQYWGDTEGIQVDVREVGGQ